MRISPLSSDLRELSVLLHHHGRVEEPLSPAACRRLSQVLRQTAKKADQLEGVAADVEELDDELQAVALDLERTVPAAEPSAFQAALKAQQFEIQQRLDEAGPVQVTRPGRLADLAVQIGNTNVFTFPKALAPRPEDLGRFNCAGRYLAGRAWTDDGGDAA